MSFDGVVSYHLNAHTCGVARFNRNLADHLGIAMAPITESLTDRFRHPLVSIKVSEMSKDAVATLMAALPATFTLILHDYSGSPEEDLLVARAAEVVAVNRKMGDRLRQVRSDVLVGFAPGPRPPLRNSRSPELKLITFGMAHKIQALGYRRIGGLLRADGREFLLEISSALHEGTEFDDQFFGVGEEISTHFGGHVEFLGFLADAEVSRRLLEADAMLAFFPEGARENNTSVAGAMNHGLAVITNLDEWSPDWMVHGRTVFDVDQLEEFPSRESLERVGRAGAEAVARFNYASLVALLRSGQDEPRAGRLKPSPS